NVILGVVQQMNPQILEQIPDSKTGQTITISISFMKRFLYEKLNWSFQANTKSCQKVPKDWQQKCYETFL
ncbi:hypothetical protein L873DRAFT_1710015, partial [Choiromyces venosus 120613-1]